MTCFGVHDMRPWKGKRRCARCGHVDPPAWAWWAKDDDGQQQLEGTT